MPPTSRKKFSSAAHAIAGAFIALIALIGLAGCSQVPPNFIPTSTTDAGDVGRPEARECHLLEYSEQFSAVSDSAPTVACAAAHTSETFEVSTAPSRYSASLSRPGVAVRQTIVDEACSPDVLRTFLQANASQGFFGLFIVGFLPTTAAWQSGERWVRCDVVHTASETVLSPTSRSTSLSAVMSTDEADRYTRCYDQKTVRGQLATSGAQIPCSQPHTSRDINQWITTYTEPTAADVAQFCAAPVREQVAARSSVGGSATAGAGSASPQSVTGLIVANSSSNNWSIQCAIGEVPNGN